MSLVLVRGPGRGRVAGRAHSWKETKINIRFVKIEREGGATRLLRSSFRSGNYLPNLRRTYGEGLNGLVNAKHPTRRTRRIQFVPLDKPDKLKKGPPTPYDGSLIPNLPSRRS